MMEAENAIITLFQKLLAEDVFKNNPVILTPVLLRTMNYNLRDFKDDVIFLGFDKFNPLLIPKNFHFEKDVWVVDSHYHGGMGVRIKGSMYFLRSEFHVKRDVDFVARHRIMDNESYDSYQINRRYSSVIGNNTIVLHTDEIQTEHFTKVLNRVPRHCLLDYLSLFASILYDKKDMGYTIEGNVILQGPYLFNLPDSSHFKGDLILVDSFMPIFPDSTRIEGELTVLSYY